MLPHDQGGHPLTTMKIYFVAGETSGDNHGAALMEALRRFQPRIDCQAGAGRR